MSRPPIGDLVRQPSPKTPGDKTAAAKAAAKTTATMSDELAAAVEAVTAVPQAGGTAAPFITTMQRAAVERELRKRARRRMAWIAAGALVVIIALHFAITRIFYRAPTADALEAYAHTAVAAVMPLYSSLLQPLQAGGHVITLSEARDLQHVRYAIEVTLRLREPLYGPATTNGTLAYRQMQESLQSARAQELKLKLFAGTTPPKAPDLPLLLQVYHRAGETIVVRVPFEARRFGWTWRIEPPQVQRRSASRAFEGATIARYAGTSYLIFGTAPARTEIRRRMTLARDYIIAVTKEIGKRADSEAVTDNLAEALANRPASEPGAIGVPPAANQPAFDPDAVAVDLPLLDPDAPAVDPGAVDPNAPAASAPAVNPVAPAVNPDAPATSAPVVSPDVPAIEFKGLVPQPPQPKRR